MSVIAPAAPIWAVAPASPSVEALLTERLGLPAIVARILASRGWTSPGEVETFLNPQLSGLHSPSLLPDFEAASEVLLGARERKERIFVHGDYDVDGVTSAALLSRFLEAIGCDVVTHVPHRMKEGYGIHSNAVDQAQLAGARVFLTCDCGTGAFDQIEKAKAFGMRVVVTDHHEVGANLPAADAIVNPHRPDSRYPFIDLSGVGVAFKLCLGLTRQLGMPEDAFQRAFLDLAALGTIADVMPLVDENRIIAKFGLGLLSKTKKLGLQALMRVSKIEPGAPVRAWDVGFRLGPRLNASGRIDDAKQALDLLLAKTQEEADRLALMVDANNSERRETQAKIIAQAEAMIQAEGLDKRSFLVVASPDWHVGIVGIVAGKLSERYRVPSLVLNIDRETGICKGSARSVGSFNLAEAIWAFPSLLQGGGHAGAAGCSFQLSKLDEVVAALDSYAAERLTVEDRTPLLQADAEVSLEEVTLSALVALSQLEPFGRGNPEPTFLSRGARVSTAKTTKDGKHLQAQWVTEDGGVEAIGFGMGDLALEMEPGSSWDLMYQPEINEWNGRRKVKLKLAAARPASE